MSLEWLTDLADAPLDALYDGADPFIGRDWLAACDNLRTCTAYGFDSEQMGRAYVMLTRDGAAGAGRGAGARGAPRAPASRRA